MELFVLNTNVLNVLNVLQDIRQIRQRLTSWMLYYCVKAILRHETSNISKSSHSGLIVGYYYYIYSSIINVLNVLYIKSLILIGASASRFPFSLTSCNVLNVLWQ